MKTQSMYPMSQFLKSKSSSSTLSFNARELACHAIETYAERLSEDAQSVSNGSEMRNGKLVVHCYRALLEYLLVKKKNRPDLSHSGLQTVSKAHQMSFEDYVRKATSKLANLTWTSDDFNDLEDKLAKWWRVVAFYSLRLSFAPIIETVILLDRSLYLYENNINSAILPIFHPSMSPRNHVLIAIKNDL